MTNKLFTVLFLLLIISCTYPLKAQKLIHYGLADGLSSTEITAICENNHYIWIATEDGLNRFDGHHFKVYKSGKDTKNSLKNNNIETLFIDSQGLLWIGFKTGGADIYNPRTDQFTHVNELVSQPIPNRVISIFEDSNHNIWLGGWEERICKLVPDNKERTRFTIEYSDWDCIASSIIEKPKGHIWIGTYTGLIMYDLKKQEWKPVSSTDQMVTQLCDTGEENVLYYSTWDNALHRLTWNTSPNQIQIDHSHDSNIPTFCIKKNDNKILIGTWGEGVKVCDKEHKQLYPLPGTEHLGTTFIYSIYKDKFENIWFGSYGKGLYKYIDRNLGINKLLSIPGQHTPVNSIALLHDKILLGTLGNGMYYYDMQTQVIHESYKSNDKFKDHILSIGQNDHVTLVGHDGIGLLYSFQGDKTSKPQWKDFQANNELEKITTFYFDKNKVWIGTKQNGLMSVCLNTQEQKITNYIHYDSCSRDRINAILPYQDNQLFIASHNGLSIFDKSKQIVLKDKIIDNEIVYSIIEDIHNQCWWIGTSNNLQKMTLHNDTLQISPVFSSYPLPQGAIKSLLLDSNQNLWFFIGEKIFCYISKEHRICELNIEYWGNLAILSAEKILWQGKEYIVCGNTEQVLIIDVEKALDQNDKTQFILTDLEIDHKKVQVGDMINGRIVLKENPEYVHSITLSYASKWISLSFTEVGETNYRNKYLYRIIGFTDKWQYLDTSVPLTLSQLNPGKYILEITKYNEEPDTEPCWSMNITVTPPWWKTPLFYFFSCLIILLGISFTVRQIILRNKKKSILKLRKIETQKKEELLKEKESFFDSLGHDLITPLSLILAPANDLLRESKENDIQHERLSIITKNATFLSDLFSTILDFKRVEFSEVKINNRNIEIVSFCRIIVNAFNYLASSKKIQLHYQTNIPSIHVWIDNVKFERILYNLLSNAIKYTPEQGSVSVALECTDKSLSVFIKDTGPGISPFHQTMVFNKFYREPQYNKENTPSGLGLGLYVVKKFVSAMNGTVSIQSQPGEGTTISVNLPIEKIEDQQHPTDIVEFKPQPTCTTNNATLLLVEDNEQILKYLGGKLAEHFHIVTATNGEEALKLTGKYLPEIIISDIIMPGMDGLTLCRHIKENPLYADIFVVLLTAKVSSEDELKGYKEGADIYIRKPFDTAALINQIFNILNTRQKRKEQLLKNLMANNHNPIEFNSKEVFLQQAMKVIEENLDKADFNMEEFAIAMNISKTVLHKKFKMLIGQTPNQFIRAIRIRKASELLISTDLSIAEIAYLTGFNQAHYFIKCFKEVYNETPKNFRDMKKGEQ